MNTFDSSNEIFARYRNNMIAIIKENYNKWSDAYKANKELKGDSLFKIVDEKTFILLNINEFSRHTILINNEELVMSLYKFHNVDYQVIESGLYGYYPFYKVENGEKVLYVFSYDLMSSQELKSNLQEYDQIKNILLIEREDIEKRLSNKFLYNKKLDLVYVSIFDLMKKMGEEDNYIQMLIDFKYELNNTIELVTVHTPVAEKITSFKNDFINKLKQFNIKDYFDEISEEDIITLDTNFKNRLMILFGDGDYAKSFYSSEWQYSISMLSKHLEQTSTIVGYIKSLEQFMFSYLMLKENQGVTILTSNVKKYNSKYIEIKSNTPISDYAIEFQPLVSSLNHNKTLWCVSEATIELAYRKLKEYRKEYRNEHLHKDNIYNDKDVEEIRRETFICFYLLLGGLVITDDEYEKLKPYKNIIILKDFNYDRFEEWLNKVLNGNILLSNKKILFNITNNRLKIETYEYIKDGFVQEINFPDVINIFDWDETKVFNYYNDYSERERMWNYYINQTQKYIKDYMSRGKYKDFLLNIPEISVAFAGTINLITIHKN